MRDKGFDLSVSSPPYQEPRGHPSLGHPEENGYNGGNIIASATTGQKPGDEFYGEAEGQVGNLKGEDFWSAARQIVEQTFLVLAPGAHAIWVVKGFVRKGKYVDFPDQWRQLCEAVGFTTLHWHNASLVEYSGTQHTLAGGEDEIKTERKSFFRRLSESKGSPKIDAEVVLCMRKGELL